MDTGSRFPGRQRWSIFGKYDIFVKKVRVVKTFSSLENVCYELCDFTRGSYYLPGPVDA